MLCEKLKVVDKKKEKDLIEIFGFVETVDLLTGANSVH